MDAKPWYLSRTVWLNAASAVFFAAEAVVQVAGTLPIPPGLAGAAAVVVNVANIILRFKTVVPVQTKGDK